MEGNGLCSSPSLHCTNTALPDRTTNTVVESPHAGMELANTFSPIQLAAECKPKSSLHSTGPSERTFPLPPRSPPYSCCLWWNGGPCFVTLSTLCNKRFHYMGDIMLASEWFRVVKELEKHLKHKYKNVYRNVDGKSTSSRHRILRDI